MTSGNFWGKGRPLKSIGTFCQELCRNNWTNRFAVWICGLGWAERSTSSIVFARWRHCPQFQSYSPGGTNVLSFNRICREGANIPDDTLPWAVQKRLNQLICHLGCGLRWVKGSTSSVVLARWRQCVHMGGHAGATWRIRLNRPSAVHGDGVLCQITLTTCSSRHGPHGWNTLLYFYHLKHPVMQIFP